MQLEDASRILCRQRPNNTNNPNLVRIQTTMAPFVGLQRIQKSTEAWNKIRMLHLVVNTESRLDTNLPGTRRITSPEPVRRRNPLREIVIGFQEHLSRRQVRVLFLFEITDQEAFIGNFPVLLQIIDVRINKGKSDEPLVAFFVIRTSLKMLGDPSNHAATTATKPDKQHRRHGTRFFNKFIDNKFFFTGHGYFLQICETELTYRPLVVHVTIQSSSLQERHPFGLRSLGRSALPI